jgi:hypothetical protein
VLARAGIRPSGRHDTAIWELAGPAVLALAADPLLGVVDTAFVGRLGPEALVSDATRVCSGVTALSARLGDASDAPRLTVLRQLHQQDSSRQQHTLFHTEHTSKQTQTAARVLSITGTEHGTACIRSACAAP